MARAKRRNGYSPNGRQTENEIENEEMEGADATAHETADLGRRALREMQQSPFNPLDLFGAPMARLMDQNWTIFQKMMHVMREESLEFVNRRLEQTSQAIKSSRDCDGISDLLVVQQEWMVNLARDYAEQTKRFAEAMRDLAEDGTSNLSHAASDIAERGRNAVEEETTHAAA
jgi:hypothetical protein